MSGRQRQSALGHLFVASVLAMLAAALVGTSTGSAASWPQPPKTPASAPQVDVTVASPFAAALSKARDRAADAQEQEPTPDPAPADTPREAPAAARPVRVVIPAIGVDAQIVPIALHEDGALAVPDFGLAGWYELGPRPGEPGPAVMAAHVDSRAGPDVFYRLRELTLGDVVEVHDAEGEVHRFAVSAVEQHPKDQLPADRIWGEDDAPALRLITCGGTFDRSVRHYTDNIVVFADSV